MRGLGGMYYLVKRGNRVIACLWAKREATAREKLGKMDTGDLTFQILTPVLEWSSK